jgi:hypothetical protein
VLAVEGTAARNHVNAEHCMQQNSSQKPFHVLMKLEKKKNSMV